MSKESLLQFVADMLIADSTQRLFTEDSTCSRCDPIEYLDSMLAKYDRYLSECRPVFLARIHLILFRQISDTANETD